MSGTARLLLENSGSGPMIPDDLDPVNAQTFKDYLRTQKLIAMGLTAIPPGVASTVLPPAKQEGEATSLRHFVPGIIPQTYNQLSGMKQLGEIGIDYLARGKPFIEAVTGSSGLPGSHVTKEMEEGSRARANDLIPHLQPTSGDTREAHAADVGNAIGLSAPFGMLGGALTSLPKYAKAAVNLLAPQATMKSMAPVAGAITSGVDTALGADTTYVDKMQSIPKPPVDVSTDTMPVPPVPSTNDAKATQPPLAPEMKFTAADLIDPATGQSVVPPHIEQDPETSSTLGKVALYTTGAVALLAGRKQAMQLADRLAGSLREKLYAGEAAKFATNEAAMRIDPNVPHVEAPLPVGVGTPDNRFNRAVFNKDAVLQRYTDVVTGNKVAGDIMRAETGLINNNAAFHGRVAEAAESGFHPETGVTFPSLKQHYERIANVLTPDQQELYNKARWYADELNSRSQTGGAAVNFPHTSNIELWNHVNAARNDPAVLRELDTADAIHRKLMEIGRKTDYFSAAEEQKMVNKHPNYLASTDTNGELQKNFGPRALEPGTGVDNIPIAAWEVDKQHFTQLLREFELNSWRRDIVDHSMQYQARTPGAAKIFSEYKPNGEWVKPAAKGDTISIRRNGVTETYKVGNTDLLRDLTNDRQLGTTMAALNYSRQLLQSGITGPIAAVAGRFFPAINFMRNTMHGSMFQAPGMSYGPLTSLAQRATGRVLHVPVLSQADAFAGSFAGLLQGIGAEGAKFGTSVLHPGANNPVNQMLRAAFGDQHVNWVARRLETAWDLSYRKEMKEHGVLGSSGYGTTELPAKQVGARKMESNPLNNMVPDLFRADGPLGGVTPKVIKLKNLYNELASVFNDASQTHLYSTNRNRVAPEVLAHEVRQFVGDPGTHGGSRAVTALTGMIPYGNMILQDVARIGRAFYEQPVSSLYKTVSTMGTAALASNYSALLAGPEYTEFLQHELTDDQRASRIYFFVPGIPPEQSPYIDLPQNIRMYYPIMLQAMHDALGVQNLHDDPPGLSRTMDWLHDFFGRHVTEDTKKSSLAGLSSNISPGMPPIVDAATTLGLGQTINPSLSNLAGGENVGRTLPGDMQAPGHIKGADPLTNTIDGNRITHAVAGMMGVAGSSILQAITSVAAGLKRGVDPMQMLHVIRDQELDRLKGSFPFMKGTVFNNTDALGGQTPLVARVEEARHALEYVKGYKSDALAGQSGDFPGRTRTWGQTLDQMPLHDNKRPTDPAMALAYDKYGMYANFMNTKIYPQISDIRDQMKNLTADPGSPEVIKTKRNEYQRQLTPLYEQAAQVINDADLAASQAIGRKVHITQIDWTKGVDQFHK